MDVYDEVDRRENERSQFIKILVELKPPPTVISFHLPSLFHCNSNGQCFLVLFPKALKLLFLAMLESEALPNCNLEELLYKFMS